MVRPPLSASLAPGAVQLSVDRRPNPPSFHQSSTEIEETLKRVSSYPGERRCSCSCGAPTSS
jgi:hypothetical protein